MKISNPIECITSSPNGEWIALGSMEGVISVWNIDGLCQKNIEGINKQIDGRTNRVKVLRFTQDNRFLISGSSDKLIRIWDIGDRNSNCISTLAGHTDSITCIVLHPNGESLASASKDGSIRIWNVKEKRCEKELKGHKECPVTIRFCNGGKRLISVSFDKTIRIWDIEGHKKDCLKVIEQPNAINSLAISPDDRYVVVGYNKALKVFDTQDLKLLKELEDHSNDINDIVFSPKGQYFASVSSDCTVRIWNVMHWRCVSIIKGFDVVNCACWIESVNGLFLATGGVGKQSDIGS